MLIDVTREDFKKEFGQELVSVWLNTPRGQKYVKPFSKGRWLLSDILNYDLTLSLVTLHLVRGKIKGRI